MKFAYFLADSGATKVYIFCNELSPRRAALHVRQVCDVVKCKINREAAAWDGMKRAAEEKSGGTLVQSVERINTHTHTQKRTYVHASAHTHTHDMKQQNMEKINNKSSVLSEPWQMEHTLSPRPCRLLAVLKSQLLSVFILLNLQPYQHMLDDTQPRLSVSNSCRRRRKLSELWKSQYGHKVCVIYPETNMWDNRLPLELGNAWNSVTSISLCLRRVRKRGLLIFSATHRHLICIWLHLHAPLHLQTPLLFHISPKFICWQQKMFKIY